MSIYRVNKLLHEVSRDRRLAERLATDPDEVFREYELSAEEAEAIRNRRLRALYEWGVNPYILLKGALALGVSVLEYPQRMNQPE